MARGIDFIIVRELTGGIYFGEHRTDHAGEIKAVDVMAYTESEIERIGRIGFETARKRDKRLCSVEKSNVLDCSRLWKAVMHRLAEEYPDVELTDMLAKAGLSVKYYRDGEAGTISELDVLGTLINSEGMGEAIFEPRSLRIA